MQAEPRGWWPPLPRERCPALAVLPGPGGWRWLVSGLRHQHCLVSEPLLQQGPAPGSEQRLPQEQESRQLLPLEQEPRQPLPLE